jgi:ketosteroid isomerase-like protein
MISASDLSFQVREKNDTTMDDIYAINLAKSHFREGYNRGDEEQVLSIYDDEFIDMSFGMPSFYYGDAREVFRARLKRLFSDYSAEMALNIISITVSGDRALDRGWHILKLTSKAASESLLVRTRYFETWRRDPVRGWLITSYIDNLDQTPQLPEELTREIESTSSAELITRLPGDRSQSVSRENSSADR